MAPIADLSGYDEKNVFTLKWIDEKLKKPLTEENLDEDDLVNLDNPSPIKSHRETLR